MGEPREIPAAIRSFRPADQPACSALYTEGLIAGKIADNDTGCDIDQIEAVYMKCDGNHFWVAEAEGRIVGTIGVQHHDDAAGQIRRLRVDRDFQRRGIGTALLETALAFCRDKNYLKVTLDTYFQRDPAVRLFAKFRFRPHRTIEVGGKEVVYFYYDLYAGEPPTHDAAQAK